MAISHKDRTSPAPIGVTASVVTTDDLEVDSGTLSVDADNNRVGIGLTDPDTTLEVLSTSAQQKWSYDGDSFATLAVDASSHTTIASAQTGDIILDAGDDIILDSYIGKWRFLRSGTLTNLVSALAADGSTMIFDNQVADADYVFKGSDGGVNISALTLDISAAGSAIFNSSVSMKEKAAADGDAGDYGQLWVKSETPCELYFTTDAGDDIQLTDGTAAAGGGGAGANDLDHILHQQVFS